MRYLSLIGLLVVALIIGWWATKSFKSNDQSLNLANQTEAVAAAQALFYQQKSIGLDMSDGPCLSEEVVPGWAVDIAHSPRESIDDIPSNQCQSYIDGKVKHFVELDTNGNLIEAK